IVRPHKRRTEIAELLTLLLKKHPDQAIYVAWDNANTHQGGEVDQVVQAANGKLVLLYLPTYSPWLNPSEMLWRHCRREVTHCEFFASLHELTEAAVDFFRRYNETPHHVLSMIGAIS